MEKIYLKVQGMKGKMLKSLDDYSYEKLLYTPSKEDYLYILSKLTTLERPTFGYLKSDICITIRSSCTNKILLSRLEGKYHISIVKPLRVVVPEIKSAFLLLANVKQALEETFVLTNEDKKFLQNTIIKPKGLVRVEGVPTFFYDIIIDDSKLSEFSFKCKEPNDKSKFVCINDVLKYKDELNFIDKFFVITNFKKIERS